MKTTTIAALFLCGITIACDEPKTTAPAPASATAPPSAAPSVPAAPVAPAASPPTPTFVKKLASECKAHPAVVDFTGEEPLEKEVRRKLGKAEGPITPAELAQIKSINLAAQGGTLHQIDPCIFPMFTSVKDIFFPPGDYDSLAPLERLTDIEALGLSQSQVKDLHPIAGLKHMDRLDLSRTLIGDSDLKVVGSLVDVTELTLNDDPISDLTPLANLKKLEKLFIKNTRVQSVAPLAQLRHLRLLDVAGTPLQDISPVQPLMSGGMKLIQE
ncbi:MAG: leucine-rich repeat domain-containing protein [Polyangiaceae bacterium]